MSEIAELKMEEVERRKAEVREWREEKAKWRKCRRTRPFGHRYGAREHYFAGSTYKVCVGCGKEKSLW